MPDFTPKQVSVGRENVWVSLPILISIAGLCLAVAWSAATFFANINGKMDNLQAGVTNKIDAMQKDLSAMNSDRIRKNILRDFAREMERSNPTMKVPDVDLIISRNQ